ncbi:MAG: hypothetical protein [Bacteriophage sp.]|jgi:hypothetical protein|nr:MAG: hypothetical protein [Bacteriophage sp.]UVX99437.1 MAG: hypothetical protein [Bacteriophage sp.]UVY02504.1 MAG: hypothetical protein [Bacteriophage sp.]UVY03020.1 MAG: hypothetical protein [Bacteriophage sp.]UVY07529.1 MAG: hypothetical protein [Bacteriophage sp.]
MALDALIPPKMLPAAPMALPIKPIRLYLIIKSYTLRAKVSRYLRIIILSFYIQIIMAIGKKTGGRQKGTPNKITALAKGMIEKWLEAHNTIPEGDVTPLIMQDFMELDPKDRVKVSTEFIKIIMPKNISIDDGEVKLTIEDKLVKLAGEEDEEE